MAMTRERFNQTGFKMTYEEYLRCYCPDCNEENCIHRDSYRRVPQIDGGLELCPHLKGVYYKGETTDVQL